MPAGRFVPGRFFEEQPDLPNWANDPAPRLSAAYDVFGDGRTAIKGNVSKYYAQWSAGWARRYANSASSSDSRNWFDCANQCGRDGVFRCGAADQRRRHRTGQRNRSELQPDLRPAADRNPAPDIERTYNWEYSAAVQHQLTSRVSVNFGWYRRIWQNLEVSDRELISLGDYTCVSTSDAELCKRSGPGRGWRAGSERDDHGLQPERGKARVYGAQIVDKNSDDQSIYDGIELSFSSRLPAGGTLFGGWTTPAKPVGLLRVRRQSQWPAGRRPLPW